MGNVNSSRRDIKESDRFLPCLFLRLQDHEPDRKQDSHVMFSTLEELKQDVLQNLVMLLNSRSHIPEEELPAELRDSVLGYGLFDFSGMTKQGKLRQKLQDQIAEQIRRFEPRIASETLQVELLEEKEDKQNIQQLSFKISGEIRVEPLAAELLVISRINLEAGVATLSNDNTRSAGSNG